MPPRSRFEPLVVTTLSAFAWTFSASAQPAAPPDAPPPAEPAPAPPPPTEAPAAAAAPPPPAASDPPAAQPPSAQAAPSTSPAPAPCVPACRAGYFCHDGRCVSICNPPCPSNQVCVDGTRCAYPTAPGTQAVYEPPPPPVKKFGDRSHSMLGFHLGFAGTVEENGAESALDPTFGANLRADIPIAQYLLLGPLLQLGAWRPDRSPAIARSFYFDLDLFVRGRVPIEADPLAFQLWVGVPIGLTLSFTSEELDSTLDGFGFGWNVGVLFGGAIHFTKNFGMFAEVGWLQHRMSHDRQVGSGDVDFRLAQGNFNVGFVFGN